MPVSPELLSGQPDAEPPRAVPCGLAHSYTAAEQQAPLDAYMAMVARHDASVARKLYTDDYLQHARSGRTSPGWSSRPATGTSSPFATDTRPARAQRAGES